MSRLFSLPSRYLTVGEPLSYDLRSPNDVLLLSKGQIITGFDQVDAILKIGACVNAEDAFKIGIINIEDLNAPAPINIPHITRKVIHRPFDVAAEWYQKVDVLLTQHLSLNERATSLAESIYETVTHCQQPMLAAIFMIPFKKYTSAHATHCAILCAAIAHFQQISEQDTLSLIKAALLMNIGSAKLQDSLFEFNKTVTDTCKAVIQQHPIASANICKTHNLLDDLMLRIIEEHHEKPDGSGYPNKLVENKIHYLSKLLHIVDIILAKMTHRSYRKPMAIRKAMGTLLQSYTDHDSQTIIRAIIKVVGIIPSGAAVKLPSGETAIITYRHATHLEAWAVVKENGERLSIPLKRRIEVTPNMELPVMYTYALAKFLNPHQLFGFK